MNFKINKYEKNQKDSALQGWGEIVIEDFIKSPIKYFIGKNGPFFLLGNNMKDANGEWQKPGLFINTKSGHNTVILAELKACDETPTTIPSETEFTADDIPF